MSNGTYSKLTAIYNNKLFNQIEVSAIYSLAVRDCMEIRPIIVKMYLTKTH